MWLKRNEFIGELRQNAAGGMVGAFDWDRVGWGDHFWCLGKQRTAGVEILIAGGERESSRGSQM